MSSAGNTRSRAEHDRPSTTFGTKPRGTSTRVGARERPISSGEVIPEDSASNDPRTRTASGSQNANGVSRTYNERQNGKIQVTTRETLQVRSKSPLKTSFDDIVEESGSRRHYPSRQGSQAAQTQAPAVKKEQKILRALLSDW